MIISQAKILCNPYSLLLLLPTEHLDLNIYNDCLTVSPFILHIRCFINEDEKIPKLF